MESARISALRQAAMLLGLPWGQLGPSADLIVEAILLAGNPEDRWTFRERWERRWMAIYEQLAAQRQAKDVDDRSQAQVTGL